MGKKGHRGKGTHPNVLKSAKKSLREDNTSLK